MLFRERLTVPVMWWFLAAGFALSILLAFGFYLGWPFGFAGAALTMIIAGALFFSSAIVITVEADRIRVGRAEIDLPYVRGATPLSAEAAGRRGGPGADARAHLVLRPYVATAVELTLADPADPVPYWLVATRRPAALVRAIETARHPVDDLSSPGA